MSKKKINNRLNKLFQDIDNEPEAKKAGGLSGSGKKPNKGNTIVFSMPPVEPFPEVESAFDFSNISENTAQQESSDINPSTMLSTAFRIDEKNWATLKVVDELEYRTWGVEEQMLVKQVADQLSLALENARLFQETQLHAEELSALNQIISSSSKTLELSELLSSLLIEVLELIGFSSGLISLPSEGTDSLMLYTYHNLPEPLVNKLRTNGLDNTLCDHVYKTKKPLVISDLREEAPVDVSGVIANGLLSYLGVPLEAKGIIVGTLCMFNGSPVQLTERNIDLSRSIGIQIGFAIENARLFQETQRRAREMTALADVAREISATLELQQVMERIANQAMLILGAETSAVYVPDPEYKKLIAIAAVGPDADEIKTDSVAIGKGILGNIALNKVAKIYNDASENPESITIKGTVDRPHEHVMAASILSQDKLSGLLAVWRFGASDRFSESELEFLESLAQQASIAVENARLFEETKRRSEELASLNEIISAASQTLDIKTILETVMKKVLEISGFDGGLITVFNETRGKLERGVRMGMPGTPPADPSEGLQGSLCDIVFNTGKSLIIQDISSYAPVGVNVSKEVEAGLRGYIGIPIFYKSRTLGTLCVFRHKNEPVQENTVSLISTIAGQLGFTVENARLFEEGRKFRLGLERSADAVFMTDIEGTIVYANSSFETIYGFPLNEVLGANPKILKSGVIPKEWYKHFWETLLNKGTVSSEITNKRKDGQLVPIEGTNSPILDESGNILGFLAIHSDISKRKENEEALKRRNEYLAASAEIGRLVTSTLDLEAIFSRAVSLVVERFGFYHASIFIIDESGANATLQEATGIAGQKLKERKHSLAVGSISTVGKASSSGEVVVINNTASDPIHKPNPLLPETKAETAIPLRVGNRTIGVLDIQSTEVDAFTQDDIAILQLLADQIAVGIDNARSYNLAQQAVEEMREVDRLKSQFLANMSHELRTPLNSIIGFARVILKGIDGPISELQQQDLTAIFNSGQHLLGLINDILDLSRIEAGKMELTFDEVNLSDLISSVMSTAVGLVKDKSIQLRSDLAEDIPMVRADAMRIRQVLINFLSNAAKFTDEGEITVKAYLEKSDQGQTMVTVNVIDSGPGIAEEDQTKLFQPFSQVDASLTRKVGGSGLGLSICRHLIEMHNGQIGVHSAPGKGSTFYFSIPVMPEPKIEKQDHEWVVLAIDDDPQNISLYERYLQPKGYKVVGLSDPAKAKERIQKLHPFAITLDIMMPGYDGWQVLTELKSSPETRDIPVIVCSIVDEEEKGFSLGAADYLVKPILEEDLLASLDRLNGDGHIREVLVIDDDPNDLRLLGKMITEQGKYKVTLAEGGPAGWNSIKTKLPHAIVLDLFMPELDGFTILERLRIDENLRHLPVIVITGADLTSDQQKLLDELGQRLLQKSSLKEKELIATIEEALQRVKVAN